MTEFQDFIEEKLEMLDFVEWDRCIQWQVDGGPNVVRVFGWIERDDQYKDFAHLEFTADVGGFEVIFLGTSSSEYSEEINERVNGKGDYAHCHRVENQFEVENTVNLDTDGKKEAQQSK